MSHSGMSRSSLSINDKPPELVAKRQQLAGLIAAQAVDPTCAPRAILIAEMQFDIERLDRKRKER
eukprot:6188810-Pleurochrysis_carterae.AAC.1